MQIPVLIEAIAGNRFHARCGEPVPISAEGATRDEAVENLRQLLEQWLKNGTELTTIDIGQHPITRFAGWLKDDPLFDEWQQAIAENRQREDEAEGLR